VFLPVAAPGLALWWFHGGERAAQGCGLILQLLGFCTVWWQIRLSLREYQRPGLRKALAGYLRGLPGRRRSVTSLSAHIQLGAGLVVGRGRIRQSKGDHSDWSRIMALEFNFEQLETECAHYEQETAASLRALEKRLSTESRALESSDERLLQRIEHQAVGSAYLQLLGLWWFVLGTVYSGLPDLVAKAVH
jgi:hypothetical protein